MNTQADFEQWAEQQGLSTITEVLISGDPISGYTSEIVKLD